MKQKLLRGYCAFMLALACIGTMALPALAAAPGTGDTRGQNMGLVIGVLVVSVLVIAVIAILGTKRKK